MNTLDTPAQMDTAHTDGYITNLKEKVSLSNALIQQRRAEHEAVKQLTESADISPDLDQKFIDKHSVLHIIYVNVKARLEKQVLFKVYSRVLTFFTRRCGIDVFGRSITSYSRYSNT